MVILAPISAKKDKGKSFLSKIIGENKLTSGRKAVRNKATKAQRLAGGAIALGIATAVVAPTAALGAVRAAAVAAAKKPIQSIAIAGVVASGAAPTIAKTIFKGSKTAGEVITGEKTLNAETISDVAKTAGIVLGVGALGTAAGYAGKKLLSRDKNEPEVIYQQMQQPMYAQAVPMNATSPITAETQELTAGEPEKPKRKRSQTRRQTINQSVRVNVVTGNKTNKFIRNAIYA